MAAVHKKILKQLCVRQLVKVMPSRFSRRLVVFSVKQSPEFHRNRLGWEGGLNFDDDFLGSNNAIADSKKTFPNTLF